MPAAPALGAPRELELPAQSFTLGAAPTGFAFDNELAAHEVEVGPLRIDAHPITWGRYLPFIEAGGYEDARWWGDAGREWLATVGRILAGLAGAFVIGVLLALAMFPRR